MISERLKLMAAPPFPLPTVSLTFELELRGLHSMLVTPPGLHAVSAQVYDTVHDIFPAYPESGICHHSQILGSLR